MTATEQKIQELVAEARAAAAARDAALAKLRAIPTRMDTRYVPRIACIGNGLYVPVGKGRK